MPLHPVLEERLNAALAPSSPTPFTARDARLPAVPGKAHAVLGMRRSGKTTFLRQLLAERRANLPAERALYLSFDDDRLVGIGVEQLGFLLEEFYRRYPALRGRQPVLWLFDEVQLAAAAGEHPRAKRRLLVLDRDAAGEIEAPGVEVLPAYDWMLAEPE